MKVFSWRGPANEITIVPETLGFSSLRDSLQNIQVSDPATRLTLRALSEDVLFAEGLISEDEQLFGDDDDFEAWYGSPREEE